MKNKNISRRRFMHQASVGASLLTLPIGMSSCTQQVKAKEILKQSFKFGMLADPHADLIPDKNERLGSFMESALSKDLAFIVQLGDFCFPKKENLDFLGLWQQYKGPKYNVLGNHDMDVSSKEVIMDFLEMPSAYYSFDHGGVHFIVLDANYLFTDGEYRHYDSANFYVDDSLRTYINPAQIEWLKGDLKSNDLPTIIFSHQSLINPLWGVKNRVEIQHLLEQANNEVGYQKVIACFNGHDHIDFHRELNGIHYIEINSMSYQWLGKKYSNKSRYSAELHDIYPNLDEIAPYQDALYSFVEIDLQNGLLKIEGKNSKWLAPSPAELGMPDQVYGAKNSTVISDRIISFS